MLGTFPTAFASSDKSGGKGIPVGRRRGEEITENEDQEAEEVSERSQRLFWFKWLHEYQWECKQTCAHAHIALSLVYNNDPEEQ